MAAFYCRITNDTRIRCPALQITIAEIVQNLFAKLPAEIDNFKGYIQLAGNLSDPVELILKIRLGQDHENPENLIALLFLSLIHI